MSPEAFVLKCAMAYGVGVVIMLPVALVFYLLARPASAEPRK